MALRLHPTSDAKAANVHREQRTDSTTVGMPLRMSVSCNLETRKLRAPARQRR